MVLWCGEYNAIISPVSQAPLVGLKMEISHDSDSQFAIITVDINESVF